MGHIFSKKKKENALSISNTTSLNKQKECMLKIHELEKQLRIGNSYIEKTNKSKNQALSCNNRLREYVNELNNVVTFLSSKESPKVMVDNFISKNKLLFIREHSLEETLLINFVDYIFYTIVHEADSNICDNWHKLIY